MNQRLGDNKKKGSNNKIYFILAGALVLIFVLMFVFSGGSGGQKVAVEAAEKRTIVETVSANGKIYPKNEVTLSPEVRGEILKIYVEEGDSVNIGDTLIKIDPDIYQSDLDRADAQLNQARANLAQMNAMYAQAEAQYENAFLSYQRQQDLYKKGIISDAEMETATSTYKTAQANLESAHQNVESAKFSIKTTEATLRQAKNQLSYTMIYAPVSGVVSQLKVKEGERVIGTSQMQGTNLMKIADLNNMEAHVDVGENDILRVEEGDTAFVEVDAYLDRKFTGIVTQIASSANNLDNMLSTGDQVTNFKVKIRILPSSYKDIVQQKKTVYPFRPGMNTTVEILTEKKANILTVPIQSVTTRESKDSMDAEGQPIEEEVVFIMDNNKVKSVNVSTGVQDDEYIEVKTGLNDGDEVVKAPFSAISRTLKDGMEVEVVEEKDLYKDKGDDED